RTAAGVPALSLRHRPAPRRPSANYGVAGRPAGPAGRAGHGSAPPGPVLYTPGVLQDSTPSVPANVAGLAESARLGALQRVYLPKRRNWALLICNIVIGIVTAIALVGFYLLWVILRTPNFSRSQAARRVYLYEQGFIVANKPDDPQ